MWFHLLTRPTPSSIKKQEQTNNYANLSDPVDMDGMGNFSRFPKDMEDKNKDK